MRFRTDDSVAHTGFRAVYETLCGGTFGAAQGRLNSPNYPAAYPAERECVYVVAQEPGRVIQLQFLTFELEHDDECTFDYLEVGTLMERDLLCQPLRDLKRPLSWGS